MLNDLHRRYVNGELSRRGFIRGAAAAIAAGVSVPAWMLGSPAHAAAAQAGRAARGALPPLDPPNGATSSSAWNESRWPAGRS
jgi:hypothetical protein